MSPNYKQRWCSYTSWHDNNVVDSNQRPLESVCLCPSRSIPIPPPLVQLLLASDPFVVPRSAFPYYITDECDTLDVWSDEEDEEELQTFPSFPEFESAIAEAIESLGGSVFPKLNWSAPKDASWMGNGRLCCQNFSDIILLLRASSFINEDLESTEKLGEPPVLVLKKWCSLNPSMEFRCFVVDNHLVGASQRHTSSCYPFLSGLIEEITQSLSDFFLHNMNTKLLPLSCNFCYTFFSSSAKLDMYDVYVLPKTKSVRLVDLSPIILPSNLTTVVSDDKYLLYSAYDLVHLGSNHSQEPHSRCISVHPLFALRVLKSGSDNVGVQPSEAVRWGVPFELAYGGTDSGSEIADIIRNFQENENTNPTDQ